MIIWMLIRCIRGMVREGLPPTYRDTGENIPHGSGLLRRADFESGNVLKSGKIYTVLKG